MAIHGYLARRAGPEAADDLLSEVWLRAFAARSKYDARHADARPWLYGIARNVLREHWRAHGGQADLRDRAAAPEDVDPWDGVDDRLDSAREAQQAIAAVRALPAAEREVLLLTAWEHLTPAEAAQVLDIPPGTARSRLHRARAAVRLLLAQHPADHPGALR